jgi:hypothetical protein
MDVINLDSVNLGVVNRETNIPDYKTTILSDGSKEYRFYSLLSLLNIINREEPIVCSPISGNDPDQSRILWRVSEFRGKSSTNFDLENKMEDIFGEKIQECIDDQTARFIVITLRLEFNGTPLSIGHANYILIDKGIKNTRGEFDTYVAIRIDPYGDTNPIFKPKELDGHLTRWFSELEIKFFLKTEERIPTGIQKLENIERDIYSIQRIIINDGHCSTYCLALLYQFFLLYKEQTITTTDLFCKTETITPSKIQGEDLFSKLFTTSYYGTFKRPINPQAITECTDRSYLKEAEMMEPGWIEQYIIAFNQKISNYNIEVIVQLSEATKISQHHTLRSDEMNGLIQKLFKFHNDEITKGIINNCPVDNIFSSILNYIIKKHPELIDYFTIFGIDFNNLIKIYAHLKKEPEPESQRKKARRKKGGKMRKTKKNRSKMTKNKKTKNRSKMTKRKNKRKNKKTNLLAIHKCIY